MSDIVDCLRAEDGWVCNEAAAEIERLRAAAWDAVNYHRLGYAGARRSEPWDADHMLVLLDRLGEALEQGENIGK